MSQVTSKDPSGGSKVVPPAARSGPAGVYEGVPPHSGSGHVVRDMVLEYLVGGIALFLLYVATAKIPPLIEHSVNTDTFRNHEPTRSS